MMAQANPVDGWVGGGVLDVSDVRSFGSVPDVGLPVVVRARHGRHACTQAYTHAPMRRVRGRAPLKSAW
jgi:hypothetical protein